MSSNDLQATNLIDASELLAAVQQGQVKILYTHMDYPVSSQYVVAQGGYIPGSELFNFEQVFVHHANDLPHMLPDFARFGDLLTAHGVQTEHTVVVYDNQGMFSSPRVWWMLKSMGHPKVKVLNGGLKAWVDAGYPTVTELQPSSPGNQYRGAFQARLISDKSEILSNYQHQDYVLIDARSPARFYAQEPEPRAGVRGGHIPGANNLHYARLLADGRLRDGEQLRQLFADIDQDWRYKRLIFSCGSGVTACILGLGAEQAGATDWAVYDGSWAEWGADHACPLATN